jgi:hypothetical protein
MKAILFPWLFLIQIFTFSSHAKIQMIRLEATRTVDLRPIFDDTDFGTVHLVEGVVGVYRGTIKQAMNEGKLNSAIFQGCVFYGKDFTQNLIIEKGEEIAILQYSPENIFLFAKGQKVDLDCYTYHVTRLNHQIRIEQTFWEDTPQPLFAQKEKLLSVFKGFKLQHD